jgi:hypothetical protein
MNYTDILLGRPFMAGGGRLGSGTPYEGVFRDLTSMVRAFQMGAYDKPLGYDSAASVGRQSGNQPLPFQRLATGLDPAVGSTIVGSTL